MMKSYTSTVSAADKNVKSTTTTTAPKTAPKKKGAKTEEANEVAGFLLSLKNQRSVSPDPNDPSESTTCNTETNATTSTTETEPSVAPSTTSEAVKTESAADAAPTASTTTAAPTPTVVAAASTESSGGVITGYAGPPPEMPVTAYSGIPISSVYPTSSYSTYAANATAASASLTIPPFKKSNAKEKKLKKSLESGVVVTDDLPSLQAMIDEFVEYDLTKFIDGTNPLVLYKDRDLVPDALFVAMLQMKVCHLTQADRVGCYKTRDLGFIGMCCMHCNGQPGFGRYFPNSVRSLAQTTTSQTILKHIASKCRFCPPNIREVVVELQRQQTIREAVAAMATNTTINDVLTGAATSGAALNAAAATGRPRYGSRKIFFQRVWSRLHAGTLGITTVDEMDEYNLQKDDDDDEDDVPTSVIDDVVTEAVNNAVVGTTSASSTQEDAKRSLPAAVEAGKESKKLKTEE